MVIKSVNIGLEIYELFHRVSVGLQGKGKTLDEVIVKVVEQINYFSKSLEDDGITINVNGKTTFHPFGESFRDAETSRKEYRRGLEGWKKRKREVEEGGVELIAKEERAFYLNPRDCVQTIGELDMMLYCHDEDKLSSGPEGVYWLRDIFLSSNDVLNYLKTNKIKPPNLLGYRKGDENQFIFIFTGITEPQIHHYGNPKDSDVPVGLTNDFVPMSRKNLGREFVYGLDSFFYNPILMEFQARILAQRTFHLCLMEVKEDILLTILLKVNLQFLKIFVWMI